jgi:hypothetical protein
MTHPSPAEAIGMPNHYAKVLKRIFFSDRPKHENLDISVMTGLSRMTNVVRMQSLR